MKFLLQISRGIVADHNVRRWCMFFFVLAAMLMLFIGLIFLGGFLMERPFVFIAYWGICGWLTFTALLLALYDLLITRQIARRERERIKKDVFRENR